MNLKGVFKGFLLLTVFVVLLVAISNRRDTNQPMKSIFAKARHDNRHLLSGGHSFSTPINAKVDYHAIPHAPLSAVRLKTALHRCSRAMGVSDISILKNNDSFMRVVNRAETFLKEIDTLLPRNFSTQYKNPCWQAMQPRFHPPNWEKMLMDKYYTKSMQQKNRSEYAHLLNKPASIHVEKNQILCLPYFFLAGFPKSATTTIYKVLTKHRQIAKPYYKEPHWWTRVLNLSQSEKLSSEYIPISFIAYTLFFKQISLQMRNEFNPWHNQLITFDGSQSTLWDSNLFINGQDYCAMPAIINRVLPNAKFIVVMRNPATRLASHFFYTCRFLYGKSIQRWPSAVRGRAAEVFHRHAAKDIDVFNECLNNKSVFECSSMGSANREGGMGNIYDKVDGEEYSDIYGRMSHTLAIGLYAVHIKKWLQFYPIQNFLFIKMEDISKDVYATMTSITDFLGIEAVPKAMADGFKQRENIRSSELQPLGSLELLEKFYRPYNEELAKLLNDDNFLWQDEDHQ